MSSTRGQRGEIFLLEMGEPVRILDLAHQMISMAGLVPDVDIQIEVTGLRRAVGHASAVARIAIQAAVHRRKHVHAGHRVDEVQVLAAVHHLHVARPRGLRRDLPRAPVADALEVRQRLRAALDHDAVTGSGIPVV